MKRYKCISKIENLSKWILKGSEKMKAIASFRDKHELYVDCSECKKGGNGTGECNKGGSISDIFHKGCCNGKLLEYIDEVD